MSKLAVPYAGAYRGDKGGSEQFVVRCIGIFAESRFPVVESHVVVSDAIGSAQLRRRECNVEGAHTLVIRGMVEWYDDFPQFQV